MKYCISCRQSDELLAKTDQIFIDRGMLDEFAPLYNKFRNKTFILDTLPEGFIKPKGSRIIVRTVRLNEPLDLENYEYYYPLPLTSFYEIDGLAKLGIKHMILSAPLTFEIDRLANVAKKYDLEFRMDPSRCYYNYIPRTDGLLGQWVRPEDTYYYESGITTFEFSSDRLKGTEFLRREKALFEIYAIDKKWDGDLNFLFENFNLIVHSNTLYDSIGRFRSTCGQKCLKGGTCSFCETALRFSRLIALEDIKNERKKKEEAEKAKQIPDET